MKPSTTCKASSFPGPAADEVILLNDFAKELNPKDPTQLIGQEITLRYGERQALPGDSSDRPQLSGAQSNGGEANSGDDFGFSVVRKTQALKVVGIIQEEPDGGMRTVSRGRIFLPVDLTEKLNMAQFTDMRSSLRGGGGKTYMTLTVRVKDPGKVSQVQDAINQMGFRTFFRA